MTDPDDSVSPIISPDNSFRRSTFGLTKREYFAAMAMAGIMAQPGYSPTATARVITEHAVLLADALILELNKAPK